MYHFPDSVLIKLTVILKNTTLWSFSPYFLFLVWFKFHIMFIFSFKFSSSSPWNHRKFSVEGRILYHTSWSLPISSSLDFLCGFLLDWYCIIGLHIGQNSSSFPSSSTRSLKRSPMWPSTHAGGYGGVVSWEDDKEWQVWTFYV